MDSLKQQILKYLQDSGAKHFTRAVRKDSEVMTALVPYMVVTDSFSEACYQFVYGKDAACTHGKAKKFKSFVDGYAFCGRAGVCACAKAAVSASVSSSKALNTKEQIKATNAKREETNLKVHGVANIGRSEKAIAARAETANDPVKMVIAREKQKDTLLERYGVSNALNLPKVNDLRENGLYSHSAEAKKKRKDTIRDNLIENPKRYLIKSLDRLKQKLHDLCSLTLHMDIEQYNGVDKGDLWKFSCVKCDYSWEQKYLASRLPKCKACNPIVFSYKSKQEIQVFDFIKSIYSGVVVSGDKSIINPFEVDILLPELKVAIEYCKLYWHSEISSDKAYSYHKHKMDLLAAKGYRLITIFSDEWVQKQELIKAKLRNILGVASTSIYARKTVASAITAKIANAFIDIHHIQGSARNASLHYGLYADEKLVSVMSFRKSKNEYELTRFCSSVNVLGGASKLLQRFIAEHNPEIIFSYADLRWSDKTNNLYEKIGFKLDSVKPPAFYYVAAYQDRVHSETLHSRLPTSPYTKWEQAQQLGYDRIWDCGKLKYVWKAN